MGIIQVQIKRKERNSPKKLTMKSQRRRKMKKKTLRKVKTRRRNMKKRISHALSKERVVDLVQINDKNPN